MFHRGHCNVNFIAGFGGRDSSVGCIQIGWIEERVMAASHEITHGTMRRLAAGSDAGGRYSDRICSSNLSNPVCGYFWEYTMSPGSSISGHVPHLWRDRNWPRVFI